MHGTILTITMSWRPFYGYKRSDTDTIHRDVLILKCEVLPEEGLDPRNALQLYFTLWILEF